MSSVTNPTANHLQRHRSTTACRHPLVATGARQLLTLRARNAATQPNCGVASACIGGGHGVATLGRAAQYRGSMRVVTGRFEGVTSQSTAYSHAVNQRLADFLGKWRALQDSNLRPWFVAVIRTIHQSRLRTMKIRRLSELPAIDDPHSISVHIATTRRSKQ